MLDSALDEASERSRDLARWLVDVGKRRGPRGGARYSPNPAGRTVRKRPSFPRLLLYGVLAAAGLQYLYVDAMLQVVSLRALIVFILESAGG